MSRPRARLWEVALAFYPTTLGLASLVLEVAVGFGLFGTAHDGSQWAVTVFGGIISLTTSPLWFYPFLIDYDKKKSQDRLREIVGGRPTRFRREVIQAEPRGDSVVIHHYERLGLLREPHHSTRSFSAGDEQSIYEYVDELRRGPDPIEHSTDAVAIARVINNPKN